MKQLPEQERFAKEVVDHLFSHLEAKDRATITGLLDACVGHGWVDEELEQSIVQNICRQHEIKVPEQYRE